MLTGLKFDSFSAKELKKSVIEVNVTLNVFGSNEQVSRKLLYNPETNKFIE
jgi:hypothetical protein